LTGVGFTVGFAVGFALADLLGVGVTEALAGVVVAVCAAALEVPELDGPALDAAALEAGALEAALETAAALDEVTPLGLPGALESAPSGAAWW
jgi:hypothetical protein